MTWNSHISCIASKLSRNIGMINRLRHYLPSHSLKTLYDSLVLPHLNYGILAWGHRTERLFKLQKRAIRTITNSKFNAHTQPLFKSLCTLRLGDILTQKTLKFYYNYQHRNLPAFFQSFLIKPRSSVHNHNTRQRNNLCVNKTKRKFADNLIRNLVIITVNSTPRNIIEKVNTHSFDGFSKYIKVMFLQDYQTDCSVSNCYVCSRNT
jgi:hypothetical protein